MDSSPPDPFVVDSASNLFKGLRLAGKDCHGKTLNMDIMDIDLLTEVPDTPDRLTTMHPQEESAEDAERRMHYRLQSGIIGKGTRIGSSDANDNESLFRKARLASSISRAHDAELSIRTHCVKLEHEKDMPLSHDPLCYSEREIERGIANEGDKILHLGIHPSSCGYSRMKMAQELHDRNEERHVDLLNAMMPFTNGPCRRSHNGIVNSSELSDHVSRESWVTDVGWKHCPKGSPVESSCNGKETGLSSDSQGTARKLELRPSLSYAYPRTAERRRLVRNGCISPSNIAKNKSPPVTRESSSSCSGLDAHDKGKGIDLSNEFQKKGEQMPRPYHFDIPKGYTAQRRLVRNGCISPLNIANSKRNGTGISDVISSPQLHILSPDSEHMQNSKLKEEGFPSGFRSGEGQDSNVQRSSRDLLVSGEDMTNEAKVIADVVCPADEKGWRSTRNRAGKGPQLPTQESSVVLVDSPEATVPSSRVYESNATECPESADIVFELDTDIRKQRGSHRLRKGKRKSNSSHIYSGECSTSAFDISEVRSLQLSREAASSNSVGTSSSHIKGIGFGCINVDKLPSPLSRSSNPGNGCDSVSEVSVARARQVESDEILARQLQEQLFNEPLAFEGEAEVDASIAWTLQQEENAQRVSSLRSHGQPNSRRIRQYPRQSSRSSVVQSTGRSRINTSARMARIWRDMRHEMDLETRLNFFEELETAFDNDSTSRVNILQMQRDFNENDYEMLLSLDDDNHHHVGASLSQINSLPLSVIKTDNIEESCAICLETPTSGDTIRHLPCFHKFHKDCIDSWLKRRSSCPICKSGLT